MHRTLYKLRHFILVFLLFSCASSLPCHAAPISADMARIVAQGWLHLDATPLGRAATDQLSQQVQSFQDTQGRVLYHVVTLSPHGVIIVAGDDCLVPIIAWLPEATQFDDDSTNPLFIFLHNDIQDRLAFAQSNVLREKYIHPLWKTLQSAALSPSSRTINSDPTDLRVASFVQSTWSQSTIYAYEDSTYKLVPLYNYYTPNNYVCGCVATAMAQLMRYHQYPTTDIPIRSFDVTVDDQPEMLTLRGGDGVGGPYVWDDMVLSPDSSITETQRQAIGALTYDAAVSVEMNFGEYSSSASIYTASNVLLSIFGYGNSVYSYDSNNFGSNLKTILNTNCDARLPTLVSIRRSGGGHAVLCDGYGYQLSVLYHHLNMGWGGSDNVWYNLPDIDTTQYDYTAVDALVYNVFPTGTGEIISGRVTTSLGTPVQNVAITATASGGGQYTAITDENGIFALVNVPSSSPVSIHAQSDTYTFEDQQVTTGHSSYWSIGNVWAADFTATKTLDSTALLSALFIALFD
ncbi:C10 family peptidase [Desulfovibrio inopinatus]|uniref:C10 family peptidase n=1 Tax=Desulfovibrio inopinatus TaxID=102109 RepID=UPI00041C0AD1|nr:C10 family peptidase [Desulfovibrio inopinatus]